MAETLLINEIDSIHTMDAMDAMDVEFQNEVERYERSENLDGITKRSRRIRKTRTIPEEGASQTVKATSPRKRARKAGRAKSKKEESDEELEEEKTERKSGQSVKYDNFKVGFGSKNDVVETPDELYKILDNEFHFDFDPAPVWPNGVMEWDGLKKDWGKSNFINPPYSKIGKWFEKAVREMQRGNTSVFLVPFRMTPKYWVEWVYPYATELRVIATRIQFKNYNGFAPFPVGIIVYQPTGNDKPIRQGLDFVHPVYPMKKYNL